MKKLLIGLGVLAVLLVTFMAAAPFVLPALIPVEIYKAQIANAARAATGRELVIKGDFKLAVLPRLELEASDVSFANAPGAAQPEMVTLKQLLVRLELLPILFGKIKVDRFVLVEPVIHLEVDKDGRANWVFETAGAEASGDQGQTEDTAQTGTEQAGGGQAGQGVAKTTELTELNLGEVRLEGGQLTYSDLRSGQNEQLDDINMELSLPDLDSPFGAAGSLVWHGEKLTLSLEGDALRPLMAGAETGLALALAAAPVELDYKGNVTLSEPLKLGGELDLNVPSIRKLAAWTGNPIEHSGRGLGLLKIKGQVAVTGALYAFTDAQIAFDNMFATGDLTADTGGSRTQLKGRLDVDQLDLNTYLPPIDQQPAEQTTEDAATNPPSDWSDAPLDLTPLLAANIDFDLTVGAIKVQDIKIDRSALKVSLKDGLLVADLTELNLYGGTAKGRIEVDGRQKMPVVKKDFVIEGIEAQPLLIDAANFNRLEGTGRFEISATTRGLSQREMIKALNGKGSFKFIDGAISGINIAAMARNPSSSLMEGAAGKQQKTDFAELSGSFNIKNGLLRNKDLLLLSPLLRVTGRGKIPMPERALDYRIEPKIVGSLEGQGGDAKAGGLGVPILITGPWHELQWQPDVGDTLKEIAKDPEKAVKSAKDTLKKLKKDGDIKKKLKSLLGN